MSLDKILKSAINISDIMDRECRADIADRMDKEVIEALSRVETWKTKVKRAIAQQNFEEVEIEIPEEERIMLEDVLISLQDSLKGN